MYIFYQHGIRHWPFHVTQKVELCRRFPCHDAYNAKFTLMKNTGERGMSMSLINSPHVSAQSRTTKDWSPSLQIMPPLTAYHYRASHFGEVKRTQISVFRPSFSWRARAKAGLIWRSDSDHTPGFCASETNGDAIYLRLCICAYSNVYNLQSAPAHWFILYTNELGRKPTGD